MQASSTKKGNVGVLKRVHAVVDGERSNTQEKKKHSARRGTPRLPAGKGRLNPCIGVHRCCSGGEI